MVPGILEWGSRYQSKCARSGEVFHPALLVKIRAPHRDARRTLSTPTRRAPHYFPCARLCATFLGSLTRDLNRQLRSCIGHCSAGGACLQKVASRYASLSWWFMWDGNFVHSCNYRRCPCDLPEIKIMERTGGAGKARRPQGSTRFSTSRRRTGPHDSHQEGR